jgi:hypothetical protein
LKYQPHLSRLLVGATGVALDPAREEASSITKFLADNQSISHR